MHTAWVIAALLLFRGAAEYQDVPCADGWSHINENRCVKYINSSKTFYDAQQHCLGSHGNLVSLHSDDEMFKVIYLTQRADPHRQSIWIGAQRSGTVVKYIDGTDYDIPPWLFDPNNYRGSEACIRLNVKGPGSFNHVRCSKRKRFVCAMSTSTPDPGPAPSPPDSDRQADPHIEERNPQPAKPKGPKDSNPISRPDTAPGVEDPPEETLDLRAKD